jgi:RNA polymerase sigma-70 factor (ECF subfamily)
MDNRRAEFEALALPHLDAAYSLARWLARSPADAEDIVQDAMLRAFRAFESARREAVRPWLMAIVRNCFHDHTARNRRYTPVGDDLERTADSAATPEAEAASASERRRLEGMLALLPDDFRTVLVLREVEDLSYREIAEAIGAPVGTVMSRLARARALLRDRWLAEDAR